MAVDLLAAADRVRDISRAPTVEIGSGTTSGLRPIQTPGLVGSTWNARIDEAEQIPDLIWRPYGQGAVRVYDKMRTDPQIQGLLWGLTLPIRRYKWFVDPNGASDQTVHEFAQDVGLQIRDQPTDVVGRTRGRFSHDDHLRHALLALVFGHMFFEQVGEIIGDGDAMRWRMRKLAPRMPHSIARIAMNETGGLAGIAQPWTSATPGPSGMREAFIEVDRLVAYVWDREASNWTGRSLLRAMYGPWLIKQTLVKVDAIKHERNGMGIPFARQTVPNTDANALGEAQKLATSIRAGEVAGATLPYGFDVDLKGVSGTLPDTLASIRYCDEVMARSVLMMFMMLGQTQSGSRALGSEFIDYISLNQEAIADWYVDTTSEHVGEDWTDWNDGPAAQAPRVGYDRDEHPDLPVADLISAIDAGLVVVSEEDEVAFRERYDLPGKGTARPLPAAPAPATAARARRQRPPASATTTVSPADHSRADFAALQQEYDDTVTALTAAWEDLQGSIIDDLVAQITLATTAAELVAITAAIPATLTLLAAVAPLLDSGAAAAIAEATAQGATLPAPDLVAAHTALAEVVDGTVAVLAGSLSQSAASRALAFWGGALTVDEIAAQVRDHLEGLSGATPAYEFAGLASRAQNEGRFTAMDGAPVGTRFYASELNDTNTCAFCETEDDTEFASMTDARRDYPAGGYVACEGGNRCRGTVVAVYSED